MVDDRKPTSKKAECSSCGGIRNCHIRGYHSEHHSSKDISWGTGWYILECMGCEKVFFLARHWDSESYIPDYDDDGNVVYENDYLDNYWPALSKRKKPDWMSNSGLEGSEYDDLSYGLLELYSALDNDMNILAGIGIRTSFDVSSRILGIDPELSFEKKLKSLVEKGHIGEVDRERISTLVDAGSASAHRGFRPSADDLSALMDTLEHFIQRAFVDPARAKKLDEKMKEMKKKVPPRAKREKKNKMPDAVKLEP